VSDPQYTSREKTLDELKNVIHELHDAGRRIIILMDEFEVITRNPRFEGQFFALLRALANTYNVAYVTSSQEDLQKMCHTADIADSPFFNIFSNLILRPFSREEALELIKTPSAQEGVPLERHSEGILALQGTSCYSCRPPAPRLRRSGRPERGAGLEHIRDVFMEEADHTTGPFTISTIQQGDSAAWSAVRRSTPAHARSGRPVRRGHITESGNTASPFDRSRISRTERQGSGVGILRSLRKR
jgi:hypothetical protein